MEGNAAAARGVIERHAEHCGHLNTNPPLPLRLPRNSEWCGKAVFAMAPVCHHQTVHVGRSSTTMTNILSPPI